MSIAAATSITIMNAQGVKDIRNKCEDFVNDYTHNGATVEESLQYAACINTIHPQPTTSDLVVFKGVALMLLVCMVIGAVRGYRSGIHDRAENVVGGIIGGAVFASGLMLIILIIAVIFI